MIYVVSDLHGYPIEKFQSLLEKTGFSDEDTLYVLGDVIDRGEDGIKYLRWIRTKKNVRLLLGNHEDMMLRCEFLFDIVTDESADMLTSQKLNFHANWVCNGGDYTIDALRGVRNCELKHLYHYLRQLPLYAEVSAGGRDFVLCHSGMGNFKPDKELSSYSKNDLIWTRPSFGTRFYEDGKITVFGHTPTVYYSEDYAGKILFTETWIDIDAGAACGYDPVILRLDDLREFRLND